MSVPATRAANKAAPRSTRRKAAKPTLKTAPAAPAAPADLEPMIAPDRLDAWWGNMVACRGALRDWLARSREALKDLYEEFEQVNRVVTGSNVYLKNALDGTVIGRVVHFLELAEMAAGNLTVLGEFTDDRDPVELAERLEREAYGVK